MPEIELEAVKTEVEQTNDETPSADALRADLFQGINFCLCDNVKNCEEIKKLLVNGGGKLVNYMSDTVTHLIADADDHPDVTEALEIYEKPVVTSRWVLLSVKADAILPTNGFNPSKLQLFSDIVACPSKLSAADVEACWAMITYFGGHFQLTLNSSCTHLISTKPEGAKYDRAIATNDIIKIVTPDWVIDSVRSKTKCDEELYHPRLLILPSTLAKSTQPQQYAVFAPGTIMNPAASQPMEIAPASTQQQMSIRMPGHSQVVVTTAPQITGQAGPHVPRIRVFVPVQQQVRLMQVQQRPQLMQQVRMSNSGQSSDQHGHDTNLQVAQDGLQPNQQIWTNAPQQQMAGPGMPFNQEQSGRGQPRQMSFIRHQQPGQQVRHLNFVQIQGPNQQMMQRHAIQHQQQFMQQNQVQNQAQQQQQQNNGQQAPRGGNVILQQRIQPPVHITAGQVQGNNNPGQQPAPLQQQGPPPAQMQQQQQMSDGQVRMMLQRPQGTMIQGALRGMPQQMVYQNHQMQRPAMSPGTVHWTAFPMNQNQPVPQPQQAQQQNTYGQPPQVQRVPQLRMQMPLRGPSVRPMRGQIPMQGQTFLQTNPDGSTQRIFVRHPMPANFQQQQQVQQPNMDQPQMAGKPMMIRQAPPGGQMVRGPSFPEGQPPQQQILVRPPQNVVVSPQVANQQQQQQMMWQQQDTQRKGPPPPHMQGQRFPIQRFAQPQQVNTSEQRLAVPPGGKPPLAPGPPTLSRAAAPALPPPTPQPQQQQQQQNPASTLQQTNQSSVSTTHLSTSSSSPSVTTTTLVTPKTKTALANLLNTRLQNSNNLNILNAKAAASSNQLQVDTNSSVNSNGNNSNSSSSDSTPTSLHAPVVLSGDGFSPGAPHCPGATFTLVSNRSPYVGSPGVVLPTGEVLHRNLTDIAVQERYFGQDPCIQIPNKLCLMGCVFYIVGFEKGVCYLTPAQRATLEKRMKRFGAEIETSFTARCTHVVTDSQHYVQAQQGLREGKRVVNIYWLNDVIIAEKIRPPWRPLHLPMAAQFNEHPCKKFIITSTGFTIPERNILREIITLVGATYTTCFSIHNTVVICKKPEGEKHKKAVEWGIPFTNTHWLFDLYLGLNDALQQPLGASLRHKRFDFKDHFELEYAAIRPLIAAWKVPIKVPEDTYKRLMNEMEEKKLDSLKEKVVSEGPAREEAVVVKREMSDTSSVKIAGVPDPVTPAAEPSDILKRPADLQLDPPAKRLKSSAFMSPDIIPNKAGDDSSSNLLTPPTSQMSLPPPPPLTLAPHVTLNDAIGIKVLFTHIAKDEVGRLEAIVKRLGGKITQNPVECSHLVVDSIARTEKFLRAFSHASHIVTPAWLEECSSCNRFVPEAKFIISDVKGEAIFGFKLKESLERRNLRDPSERLLFKNFVFYITPDCIPSPRILVKIIESAGGCAVLSRPPTRQQLSSLEASGQKFVVISCPENFHLCTKFHERKIHVVNAEFIFFSILKQEIEYDIFGIARSQL
ncbi:PAX-interacting protein 1 [Halotydeus destructor]|nr:PAX-interacting protein 1 [Halotydeus destructor]